MLAAVISAVLLRTQFHHGRRLYDLLLLAALGSVAWTEVVFRALPAFSNIDTETYGAGASLACTLLLTGILLAAAFADTKRLIAPELRLAMLAGLVAVGVVLLGIVLDGIAGVDSDAASPVYEPLVMTLSLISFCGLLLAGFGFASRADGASRDRWLLAAATYLLATASLQQLVLPLAPDTWLSPGQLFRFSAYVLLLTVSVRIYRRTRDRLAQEAVTAERVRIARDLHDGLAQDLAFISAHGERLEREFGKAHPLAVAARRALAASREAIVDLEASEASTTSAALTEVADELGAKFGVNVTVREQKPSDPDVSMADRREIVRIAREAIVNAIRHGGARNVEVTLGSKDTELVLQVVDDGCGLGSLAAQTTAGTGLGMRAMRARAWALDSRLVARRRDTGGTEISVIALDLEKKRKRHYR
jgi:signal transduction histidine kinase